tara:strand:+ start:3466 stop:3687 length:222 start_codon:yes stop_codon:yes gene_type:complete
VDTIYAISAAMTALSALVISIGVFGYLTRRGWRENAEWLERHANESNDRAWETFETRTKQDFEQAYHDYARKQ